jgi:serine/threonine protein kinase
MDVAEQQIPSGEQIGPYVVSRRLGAGGMGEVYLARHRHLDRDAAVKVLLPEISLNQTVVSRFFTEARATAQLRHPNIVEIFDCDVLPDGRAYIVMEYLRGESLRQTLDRVGRLSPSWSSIAAIAGMVADALHAAHQTGIVHRDLKPDNTYLTAQRSQRVELTVKVLDFGIAKLLSGDGRPGSSATRTGSLIGTPLYMSPEQCRGVPNIDHRADIYSLGCVLFEMVVGQPPFVAEAPGDILMAHMLQEPPLLSALDSSVPEPIAALVARMLAKDPVGRPETMAEVVAILEGFLGIPKTDFATALRPPPGFPEQVAQPVTQILTPATATPMHATPARPPGFRPTPAPPKPSPAPATVDSGEVASPAITSRPQRTPISRSPSRRGSASEAESEDRLPAAYLGADRPKWLVPVVILVPVIVLGALGAYWLSRPRSTQPPVVEPERPAKPEPAAESEPTPKPGGFVPPTEKPVPAPAPAEPSGSLVPPKVPEPEKPLERKITKKRTRGSKRAERAPSGMFKAVGD